MGEKDKETGTDDCGNIETGVPDSVVKGSPVGKPGGHGPWATDE